MEATTETSKLSMNCERDRRILARISKKDVYFSELMSDEGICSVASDTIIKEHLTSLAGQGYIIKDGTDKYYLSEIGQKYLSELQQGITQQTINGPDLKIPCQYCGEPFTQRGMANHLKSCPSLKGIEDRERLADRETIAKLQHDLENVTSALAAQKLPPSPQAQEQGQKGDVKKEMVLDNLPNLLLCQRPASACNLQVNHHGLLYCAENCPNDCQEAEKEVDSPGVMTSKEAPGYPSGSIQSESDRQRMALIDGVLRVLLELNLAGKVKALHLAAECGEDNKISLEWEP